MPSKLSPFVYFCSLRKAQPVLCSAQPEDFSVPGENEILKENEYFRSLLEKQTLQIQALLEANLKSQKESQLKESISKKKRSRQRKPLKDPVSLSDLKIILSQLNSTYPDPIKVSRYRVACVLLYLLGIRINEARQITIQHLKRYLKGHSLYLVIGKSKVRTKVEYPSAPSFTSLLKELCTEDLQLLMTDLGDFDALIPYSREHFTREINKVFKICGNLVNKTLVSHSCRVSFITRVCKTAGIEAARVLVGHSNISTTQVYNRNYLSHGQHVDLLEKSLGSTQDLHIDKNSDLESLLSLDSEQ